MKQLENLHSWNSQDHSALNTDSHKISTHNFNGTVVGQQMKKEISSCNSIQVIIFEAGYTRWDWFYGIVCTVRRINLKTVKEFLEGVSLNYFFCSSLQSHKILLIEQFYSNILLDHSNILLSYLRIFNINYS